MAAINDKSVSQTQQLMDRKQLLCRFHIRGSCRDGEWCQFSHDSQLSVPIPETVCWFYLQSHCMYGDNCRFVHLDASAILSDHQIPAPMAVSDEESHEFVSHTTPITPIPQAIEAIPEPRGPTVRGQQTISNNRINSEIISNCCESTPKTSCNSSNSITIKPHLVPYNPTQVPQPQQSNQSSNPSLITDSRQSSQDSGFSESPASATAPTHPMSVSSSSSGSCSAPNPKSCGKTYAQIMASKQDSVHMSTTSATSPHLKSTFNTTPVVVQQSFTITTTTTTSAPKIKTLCPYAINSIDGVCPYPDGQCQYTHGSVCDLCGRCCLDPHDVDQQNKHRDECIKEHEREMEISFAVQRSLDKACGICMDIVIEKEPITERRFGILEKCSHIFCLSCIRKWRQTKQFDNRTIRACPECRVSSDFVIPSKYWYDEQSEKQQLIESYKSALSAKPCKYFKQGQGECPFAGACFYLHAYPDGRKAEMPPPRQRRRQNHEGELETLRDMLLWNYLEVRDDNHWLLTLDLEDVFDIQEMGLLSGYETDDESDLSDYAEGLIG